MHTRSPQEPHWMSPGATPDTQPPRSPLRPRESVIIVLMRTASGKPASGSCAVCARCVWSGGACWLSPGVVWAAAEQELSRSHPRSIR